MTHRDITTLRTFEWKHIREKGKPQEQTFISLKTEAQTGEDVAVVVKLVEERMPMSAR